MTHFFEHSQFKRITNSLAEDFTKRFHVFSTEEINYDPVAESYQIDEDRNGIIDYSFDQPDFNFIQFRSNLVTRWEYIPGSELFLVWSQGTTFQGDPQDRLIPSLTENIFERKVRNFFLVKLTYRFLL